MGHENARLAKCRTRVIVTLCVLVSALGGYHSYQWAVFPSKVVLFSIWKEEWNTSGIKWAKDCYGPVILQKTRLGDRWWKLPLTDEQQWQLRDIWRAWETRYRLSLLCLLFWLGFMGMLLLWVRERDRTRKLQRQLSAAQKTAENEKREETEEADLTLDPAERVETA
jgi:hypothetical protein